MSLAATAMAALLIGFGIGGVGSGAAEQERDEAIASEQDTSARLAAVGNELESTQADLAAAESEAADLTVLLAESLEEADRLQEELDTANEAVTAANERADTAEDEARTAMEEEFAPKQAALDERAGELDSREQQLEEREAGLDQREADLDDRDTEVDRRADELAAAESSVVVPPLGLADTGTSDAPAPGGNCHPAYDPCVPPAPPDLDCPDIGVQVTVDHSHGDPHGFDRDGDGVGCESY